MKKVKIDLEIYANFKGNRTSVPELITYLIEENNRLKKIIDEIEIFLEEHEATYTLKEIRKIKEKS